MKLHVLIFAATLPFFGCGNDSTPPKDRAREEATTHTAPDIKSVDVVLDSIVTTKNRKDTVVCGKILSFKDVPQQVVNFVRAHCIGYSFPPIELYAFSKEQCWQRKEYVRENADWPPYCAPGDFNGDNYDDYAVLLVKRGINRNGILVWTGTIFVLHGTETEFRVAQEWMAFQSSGVLNVITVYLAHLPPGPHKVSLVHRAPTELDLANESFIIYGETSVLNRHWDGSQYAETYLQDE